MSKTEHALELLARLNADDRSWIVQRLSAAAKSRLIVTTEAVASVAADAVKTAESERPEVSVTECLCGANPERICAALRAEPTWLVSALLRVNKWPWSKQLLQSLPPAHRAEISRLERQGTSLSRPAMEVLLQNLAERVGAPTGPYIPPSRFEVLIAQLRRLGRT